MLDWNRNLAAARPSSASTCLLRCTRRPDRLRRNRGRRRPAASARRRWRCRAHGSAASARCRRAQPLQEPPPASKTKRRMEKRSKQMNKNRSPADWSNFASTIHTVEAKSFQVAPIVHVVPLKKMAELHHDDHRCTSTVRGKESNRFEWMIERRLLFWSLLPSRSSRQRRCFGASTPSTCLKVLIEAERLDLSLCGGVPVETPSADPLNCVMYAWMDASMCAPYIQW